MLSKISRKPKELLWQVNIDIDKNKPKLHKYLFFATCIEGFYVFGEFTCDTWIFHGVKGVGMATKVRQEKAKFAQILIPCKKSRNFSHVQ